MKLPPGQRFSTGPHTLYEITERRFLTSRHIFYGAKKVFWNYREQDPQVHEAGDDEALRVLVRTPLVIDFLEVERFELPLVSSAGVPPIMPCNEEAPALAAHDPEPANAIDCEFGVNKVLDAAGTGWFLEPLDTTELAIWKGGEEIRLPLLVCADAQGDLLSNAAATCPPALGLRICHDVLLMLELLHTLDLVSGGVDAGQILLHPSGRWWLLSSDCIEMAPGQAKRQADIVSWAAFCLPFLAQAACAQDRALFAAPELLVLFDLDARYWHTLARSAPEPDDGIGPAAEAEFRWLLERLKRVANRPASARELVRAPSRFEQQIMSLRSALKPLTTRLRRGGAHR